MSPLECQYFLDTDNIVYAYYICMYVGIIDIDHPKMSVMYHDMWIGDTCGYMWIYVDTCGYMWILTVW